MLLRSVEKICKLGSPTYKVLHELNSNLLNLGKALEMPSGLNQITRQMNQSKTISGLYEHPLASYHSRFDSISRSFNNINKTLERFSTVGESLSVHLSAPANPWEQITASLRDSSLACQKWGFKLDNINKTFERFSTVGESLSVHLSAPANLWEQITASFRNSSLAYQKWFKQPTRSGRNLRDQPNYFSLQQRFSTENSLRRSPLILFEELVLEEKSEEAMQTGKMHFKISLLAALKKIGPHFVAMWEGAWASIRSNNPDKSRYISVSLRGLIQAVLERFAPDDEIRESNIDPNMPRAHPHPKQGMS